MTKKVTYKSRGDWIQTGSSQHALVSASKQQPTYPQHMSTLSGDGDSGSPGEPGHDVVRHQGAEVDGNSREENHMNPAAALFVANYTESQQQNALAPSPFSPVPPFDLHSQPFPPPPPCSFLPYPNSHPPFQYQPFVPGIGPQCCTCHPSCSYQVPPQAPFFCYGPCCYVPMAPQTPNSFKSHWFYPPSNQQISGLAAEGRFLPAPAPIQGLSGQHAMNAFSANPMSTNSAGDSHSPMISISQNRPVTHNLQTPTSSRRVLVQSNVSRGTDAPKPPEYKGPLIVPPAPKQSLAVPGPVTHSAASSPDSPQGIARVNGQSFPQGGVSLLTRQMAAASLSNANPDELVQVRDITVANTTIMVEGSPFEIPIDDGARYSVPPKGGVLKLMNIPYSATKQEVVHLMGNRAKLLPTQRGTSVHIIMERSTAKTMDCYVEFVTIADAKETLEWLNRGLPAVFPKLGDRRIDIELSSQDELLKVLFPRAKCITWTNGRPVLMPNDDPYSVGFQSFLTAEEIFCMIRNAEMPKRAPFANKCPQRTYEALISTIQKFPWNATTLYTVEDRNALFHACYRQLEILMPRVAEARTLGLDSRLVLDLLNAGLYCPTFTERQKAALHSAANDASAYNSSPETAKFWPFDILVQKPNVSREAANKFARLVSAGVQRKVPGTEKLANKWVSRAGVSSPFGPVWLEFAPGHTTIRWHMAIQHEVEVLRDMVEEGLRAMREAPPRRAPRGSFVSGRASRYGGRGRARRP